MGILQASALLGHNACVGHQVAKSTSHMECSGGLHFNRDLRLKQQILKATSEVDVPVKMRRLLLLHPLASVWQCYAFKDLTLRRSASTIQHDASPQTSSAPKSPRL